MQSWSSELFNCLRAHANMDLRICATVLWVILADSRRVLADKEAPYSIEVHSFQALQDFDKTWFDWDTLQLKKVARNTYALTGDAIVNRNIGDQQKIAIQVFMYDLDRKQRGAMVFDVNKPFCKYVQEDEDTYPKMAESSNLPKDPECPFPKGTYTFEKYEMETTFLPNETPKGDYLIAVYFKDNELNVAGIEAEITVT